MQNSFENKVMSSFIEPSHDYDITKSLPDSYVDFRLTRFEVENKKIDNSALSNYFSQTKLKTIGMEDERVLEKENKKVDDLFLPHNIRQIKLMSIEIDGAGTFLIDLSVNNLIFQRDSSYYSLDSFSSLSILPDCKFFFDNIFKISIFNESETLKIVKDEYIILNKKIFLIYDLTIIFYSFEKHEDQNRYCLKFGIKYNNKEINLRIYNTDGLIDFMKHPKLKEFVEDLQQRNIRVEKTPVIFFNYNLKQFVLIPGEDSLSTCVFLNKNFPQTQISNNNSITNNYPVKVGDEFLIGVNKRRIRIIELIQR